MTRDSLSIIKVFAEVLPTTAVLAYAFTPPVVRMFYHERDVRSFAIRSATVLWAICFCLSVAIITYFTKLTGNSFGFVCGQVLAGLRRSWELVALAVAYLLLTPKILERGEYYLNARASVKRLFTYWRRATMTWLLFMLIMTFVWGG